MSRWLLSQYCTYVLPTNLSYWCNPPVHVRIHQHMQGRVESVSVAGGFDSIHRFTIIIGISLSSLVCTSQQIIESGLIRFDSLDAIVATHPPGGNTRRDRHWMDETIALRLVYKHSNITAMMSRTKRQANHLEINDGECHICGHSSHGIE